MDKGIEQCINHLCRYHKLDDKRRQRLLKYMAEIQLTFGVTQLAIYAAALSLLNESPNYATNIDALGKRLLSMRWDPLPEPEGSGLVRSA